MNSLTTPVFEAVAPLRGVTRSVLYFSCFLFLFAVLGRAQTAVSEQKTMTLEELQQMALQSNPTFAQSVANIQAAEGRKKQSGLYPNQPSATRANRQEAGRFTGASKDFLSSRTSCSAESWA